MFFLHIRKYLRAMTTLLENGLPAFYVMDATKGPLAIKLDRKFTPGNGMAETVRLAKHIMTTRGAA